MELQIDIDTRNPQWKFSHEHWFDKINRRHWHVVCWLWVCITIGIYDRSGTSIDPQAHRENMGTLNDLKTITPDIKDDLELELKSR